MADYPPNLGPDVDRPEMDNTADETSLKIHPRVRDFFTRLLKPQTQAERDAENARFGFNPSAIENPPAALTPARASTTSFNPMSLVPNASNVYGALNGASIGRAAGVAFGNPTGSGEQATPIGRAPTTPPARGPGPITPGIQYVYRPGGPDPEANSPYGLVQSGGALAPTVNDGLTQYPGSRDPVSGRVFGNPVDYDARGIGRSRIPVGISDEVRSVFPERYSEMIYNPNTGNYDAPQSQYAADPRRNVFLGSRLVADQRVAQDAASNVTRMQANSPVKSIRQNAIRKLEADELQKIRDAAARGAGATGNAWARLGPTAKQPSKQDLADDKDLLDMESKYLEPAKNAGLSVEEYMNELPADSALRSDYLRKLKGYRSRHQPESKPGSVGLTGGAAVGKEAPAKPAPSKDAIRKANPGKSDSELAPLFSKYGLE